MKLLFSFIFLLLSCKIYAQNNDTLILTLQQVVQMAKEKSIASKQAITTKETKYWQWRTYRSNYQPQLIVKWYICQHIQKHLTRLYNPMVPSCFNLFTMTIQRLTFLSVKVLLQQEEQFMAPPSCNGIQILIRKILYTMHYPMELAIHNHLWQYNSLKWDNKIEPLKYNESKQAYIESMEQVSINATGYFFDLLIAQVNLHIAETNLANTNKYSTHCK